MLVRAFRLTDKLGNAALKTLAWFGQAVIIYGESLSTVLTGMLRFLWGILWTLARAVGTAAAGVIAVVVGLLGVLTRHDLRGVQAQAEAGPGMGRAAAAGRRGTMVRRADADVTDTVVLVEDPLKARNRTLSALAVVLLAVVVILLLWATSPNRQSAPIAPGVALLTTPEAAQQQPTPFATAVPTVTPRPEALRVGGSLVYSVRENGQDDLWATVIGQSAPVHLTGGPADDRDPAWSPDGRQVAFASNRDGNWELYVLDTRSGEVTRLTYTLGFEGAPSWSPDGQWLVYEGYAEDNLDIYITRLDGTQGPIRLTYDPAPDFSPAWSPGGREIAYVSWREGNQDIYLLSLDDPSEELTINLTGTPDANEDDPAWSPDGLTLAYGSLAEGLAIVYARPVGAPRGEPVVIDRGRMPAWSPDGNSLVYCVDQGGRTFLVAGQYQAVGVASEAVSLPGRAADPSWTAATLPSQGTGAMAVETGSPLYREEIVSTQNAPPYYRLILLNGVNAPSPHLNDRVNDSFTALRQAVLQKTGQDYLGDLEDVFWGLDRVPEPGQERRNWHMTGRAFALNRNLIYGFPSPLEIVREDVGPYTYWRVYVRAAVQNGQLGEPLRQMPWDFTARTAGDVQAYDEGGRLRGFIPSGYYVDLTQLAEDYGWQRLPADRTWRYNFGGVLFWEFVKTDGLSWEEAMLDLYSQDELNAFLNEPTPFPTPTLAPPTPTVGPTRTPTPIPPDQQPEAVEPAEVP